MPVKTPASIATDPPETGFTEEARHVLALLRRATGALIGSLADADRPVRLADRLSIDRSLAWKVWQVGHGEAACPSAAHIPGSAGFEHFLQAAGTAGAPLSLVERARSAFQALEALLRQHAGDRTSGAMMLGSLSDEGRDRLERAVRRGGFRAQSHFLGVQTRVLYQADLLIPTQAGFWPDVARLRGHFGLQRTRANVPWIIARSTPVNADGPIWEHTRQPLEPGTAAEGESPLLVNRFCSSPRPRVNRRVLVGVTVEDELEPGPIGQTGAVDVVTGELVRVKEQADTLTNAVTMAVSTPCEHLVHDVLIVQGRPGAAAGPVELRLHATVHGDLPYLRGRESYAVPVMEQFVDLGPVSEAPAYPSLPRHAEMLDWLLERTGNDPAKVRLYRLTMRMPPLPSCAAAIYRIGG